MSSPDTTTTATTNTTEADHEEGGRFGHSHGFWGLPRSSPSSSDWDTAWTCKQAPWLYGLPDRNLARHHGGWNVGRDEAKKTEKRRRSSSNSPVEAGEAAHLNHFPHPVMSLPPPTVEFDFRFAARLACLGSESVSEAVCGSWSGSFGSGVVLVVCGRDPGRTDPKNRAAHRVDATFELQTSDEKPAVLEMETKGHLSGPADVLDRVILGSDGDARVDPRRYCFRVFISLATTDERYAGAVASALWVGSGMWDRGELVIE
ncbi:hypothetical protein EsH8_III_001448 [Colletotrichum jinshuiense]